MCGSRRDKCLVVITPAVSTLTSHLSVGSDLRASIAYFKVSHYPKGLESQPNIHFIVVQVLRRLNTELRGNPYTTCSEKGVHEMTMNECANL